MSEMRTKNLAEFQTWVAEHITGDEKGEAQLFLDRLFLAFGQKGVKEAGATLEMRIKREDKKGTAFADLVWKPHVLIEMKKRGTKLEKHYRQAFDYWTRLVPDRPRYVVLCNFDEFWVYDFATQMDAPVDKLSLEDLPHRFGPLAFLFPAMDEPTFENDQEAVTRAAADRLATCFNKLVTRGVDRNLAQRFVLQMLVGLFSEDIGLLDKYFVAKVLEDCHEPADAFDLLGGMFVEMNTPGITKGGRFKGVDYFNDGIFAEPARLELHSDELNQLREAAKGDWSKVRPEIFGTLFEHSLGAEERHAFGAHFTSHVDIMKIVTPTIVEPWRDLIENASTVKRVRELQHRMQEYRVLDPACGSGNFLYIAYRELKRLEFRLFERLEELSKRSIAGQRILSYVTARQFFGMDINPFAVELAKVTMMIARKFAIDELHISEPALPLDNLDKNFVPADALIDKLGNPTIWPAADVVIGNPPFLGAKRLKPERGPDYVKSVRKAYPDVPGMADYCVYWIRRTHDHLPECTIDDTVTGRAGLVGTQNIRNNKSRVGGFDHVVKTGTILEAVENQPWSGEANVHVSIANWVNTQDAAVLSIQWQLWFQVESKSKRKKKTATRTGISGEGVRA
jgi:type II restriction/modification system DNA methylase subunit YeeA